MLTFDLCLRQTAGGVATIKDMVHGRNIQTVPPPVFAVADP